MIFHKPNVYLVFFFNQILEGFMQRLNDINGKVSSRALTILPSVLSLLAPHLSEKLRPVSNEMVKNLAAQIPSKNDEIRTLALKSFDSAISILGT